MQQKPEEEEADIGSRVLIDEHLRLSHVVGQDEAVKSLRGLVKRIVHADIFDLWAVDKPKALALTGPPGVGKTFSIRALANEVKCPLMELCYEDIASHLYDESIRRLSSFKKQVEAISDLEGHVLILIDEADSFFQSRFDSDAHAADKKKTNFFLRWIDGDLEGATNFTIIAASNAWENVDPALKRSGRFVEIKYDSLSPEDVEKALLVHIDLAEKNAGRQLFKKFKMGGLTLPEGISGADVKEMVSEACLDKALFFLKEFQKKDNKRPPDPADKEYLITPDELKEIALKRTEGLANKKKRVGFARN
tara:strand:+ start:4190 stop:5110 length:921 start_codon:yes stop_codon:yes gene_type:complete